MLSRRRLLLDTRRAGCASESRRFQLSASACRVRWSSRRTLVRIRISVPSGGISPAGLATGQTPLGFQLTFFRSRTDVDPANPSAFAAHQLVIAHAAIADPAHGSLLLDERIARTGFGLAGQRAVIPMCSSPAGACVAMPGPTPITHRSLRVTSRLASKLLPVRRPGCRASRACRARVRIALQASYYYSRPQLKVQAQLERDGRMQELAGIAWLDHEWSSAALAPGAVGWDWIGMNLDDGSALVAFQIRTQSRPVEPPVQTYAAIREASGRVQTIAPEEVSFTPLRYWNSSRHRTAWPVAQRVRIGTRVFETQPLMDDQELDSSLSTGAVYWEGASELLEAGRPVGRGYLEMTGYVAPLKL